MPWDGLARTFRAGVHNSSPIYVKRNILVSTFIPHKLLLRTVFARWMQGFLVFGNGYLERRDNALGRQFSLEPALGRYMRRGTDVDRYFFVQNWKDKHKFKRGSVFALMGANINQEVYGLPDYLSALNATCLNDSATLFRRRYYKNGSHAGFILYLADAAQGRRTSATCASH